MTRLVSLNAERAAEEAAGLVRWLRPAHQAGGEGRMANGGWQMADGEWRMADSGLAAQQGLIRETVAEEDRYLATAALLPWPSRMAEQAQAVRGALASLGGPATAAEVAAAFEGAPVDRVGELLETLAGLGQVETNTSGLFTSS